MRGAEVARECGDSGVSPYARGVLLMRGGGVLGGSSEADQL